MAKVNTTGSLVITGADVAEMRRMVGLSQAELARRLGYSRKSGQAYISNMEHGRCSVPRMRYQAIMAVLLAAKQEHDALTTLMSRFRGA